MVSERLGKVIDIAKGAGEIVMKHYGPDVATRYKEVVSPHGFNRMDPVTVADEEADAYIRERLAEEFPSEEILSEESPTVPSSYDGRFWCVDPIDGTRSFKTQQTGFAILIGLANGIQPELGVVYAPAKETMFYAERGKGAFRSVAGIESKIEVSDWKSIQDSRFVVTNEPGQKVKAYTHVVQEMVGWRVTDGGAGLRMSKVAAGEGDTYIHESDTISKWDTCAAQCIIEEAGGKVSNVFGAPLNYKQEGASWKEGVAASNGTLHGALIEEAGRILEKHNPEEN